IPQALLWETFTRGRWTVPGMYLFGNLLPLLVYGGLSRVAVDKSETAFIVMQHIFLTLVVFQFAIGIVAAFGPMSRLYTAPISNASLVAWHMFAGGILLALEVAASAWIFNLLFQVNWPIGAHALFAVAAWSAFQILLGVSAQKSLPILAFALIPLILLFLWLSTRYGAWLSMPRHYWSKVTPMECVTLIGTVAVSYVVTIFGVGNDRCGGRLPSLGIVNWLVRTWEWGLAKFLKKSRPFRSPAQAQFWYEWNIKGAAMPIMFFTLLVVLSIMDLAKTDAGLLTQLNVSALHRVILEIGGVPSIIAIFAGAFIGMRGCETTVRQRDPTLGDVVGQGQSYTMGQFQATRPMVASEFGNAILRTVAGSIVITWLMWFAIFVGFLLVTWFTQQIPNVIFPSVMGGWYLPLTLVGPWIVMANAAVIGLTGRGGMLMSIVIVLATSYTIANIALKGVVSSDAQLRMHLVSASTVSVAIALAAVIAFTVAYRRGCLGMSKLIAALTISIAIITACILLGPFQLSFVSYLIIIGLASLTVLPFASTPLALAWNRHR
ncbi:MAG TPA: hypothetical protein VM260_02460, partial [Pirellula sp.]|nr:hypothetical protein [Pirellula sp.]